MLVVGDKEKEINAVGVRKRGEGDIGQMTLTEFANKIENEVKNFEK